MLMKRMKGREEEDGALTLTGPSLPEGCTSYRSRFLFTYLSAYFYPWDQDSDGSLRNTQRETSYIHKGTWIGERWEDEHAAHAHTRQQRSRTT